MAPRNEIQIPSSGNKCVLSVRVEPEVWQAFKTHCERNWRTTSDVLTELVRGYIGAGHDQLNNPSSRRVRARSRKTSSQARISRRMYNDNGGNNYNGSNTD